jgi:hypothetical protein
MFFFGFGLWKDAWISIGREKKKMMNRILSHFITLDQRGIQEWSSFPGAGFYTV